MATRIKVVKAKDLLPMDFNGKSDPYCKLALREKQVRTKTVNADLNPTFNEEFLFEGKRGGMLLIEVWDYDKFSSDDFIGSVVLQLDKVPNDFSEWVPLESRSSKKAGELFLEISYTP